MSEPVVPRAPRDQFPQRKAMRRAALVQTPASCEPRRRTPERTGQEPSVIVGVDGCGACDAALRYAVEEAGRRGCRLVVVAAYGGPGAPIGQSADAVGQDHAREARAAMQRCLEQARAAVAGALRCRIVTAEMRPVDALAAVAQNAVAIVVGRHHGEAARTEPVGSTTARLLDHSPVPVISVPPGYCKPGTLRRPSKRAACGPSGASWPPVASRVPRETGGAAEPGPAPASRTSSA